jgi:hypothetical protein
MKNELINIKPENIIVYPKIPTKMIFYMRLNRPVKVVTSIEDMKKIIKDTTGKIAIVSYNKKRYLRELTEVIPKEAIEKPDYMEGFTPFENKKDARKICVWLLNNK